MTQSCECWTDKVWNEVQQFYAYAGKIDLIGDAGFRVHVERLAETIRQVDGHESECVLGKGEE